MADERLDERPAPEAPDRLSRRELLRGASAAALAGAAAGAAGPLGGSAEAQAPRYRAARRAGGDVRIELRCAFLDRRMPDGTMTRLRAYNGRIPGPPIVVDQGTRLHVRVRNDLPPYDSSAWQGDHNVPHRFDLTNLHVHGLDVQPHLFAPLGTSDPLAQMIAIGPGEALDYVFDIPPDQSPGLYWYHPHHHGSTAVQAVSGMAGAIIVRGAIDTVPEIAAARDIPLVVQDIGLFPSEDEPDLWTYLPRQNAIWQTFGGYVTIFPSNQPTGLKGGFTTGDYALRYFLLNGDPFFKETHNPDAKHANEPVPAQLAVQRISIRPGEVVRFRMLNACSDNLMPIAVEGHEMHLLALDGVNFPAVRTIPVYSGTAGLGQVLLAPANRAEFLIKGAAQPGLYKVLQLAQAQQFLVSVQKTIFEIEVAGEPMNMGLPTALPVPTRYYPLIAGDEIANARVFEFGGNFRGPLNPVVGLDFVINNALYDESAVPTVVRLGDAEEWQLIVGNAHHGGTEGHPFHVHVQPFEVISINGEAQPPGTIQDTIWIPQNSTVVIRMRFKQWLGKSVFHCHILPHEDTGMMQNFLIVDADRGGHHHPPLAKPAAPH